MRNLDLLRLLRNLLGKVVKPRHINLIARLRETQSKRLRYFLSTLGQKQLANLLDRRVELFLRLRGRSQLLKITDSNGFRGVLVRACSDWMIPSSSSYCAWTQS